jgi:hypothetical protein
MKRYRWNMPKLCNSIKRQNLQIMDTEGEEVQAKSTGNIFNTVVENFQILRKRCPSRYRRPLEIQTRSK